MGRPSDVSQGKVAGRQDVEPAEGIGLADGSHLLREGLVGVLGRRKEGDERRVVLWSIEEVVQEVLGVVGEKGCFISNCP